MLIQRVLSNLSLQCIGTRFSNFEQVPPVDPDGFRRIPNPFNLPPISNRTIAEPLYIAIPEYLHSIETLQFLGFQRAKAEEIFANFTLPESQVENSTSDLVRLAEVYITAADVAAKKNAQIEGQPLEDDITKCISLVQDYMEIDFDGVRLDLIDEPNRPLVLSTVKEWVISTTVRRYHFLCRLDSIFRKFELALQRLEEIGWGSENHKEAIKQLNSAVIVEGAKRKARNRKKAQAKKAAKQKRKALGTREADNKQAERYGEGGSQYLLGEDQLSDGAEEEEDEIEAVQVSTNSNVAQTSSKVLTL